MSRASVKVAQKAAFFFRVRWREVGTLVGVMRLYAKLVSMILVFAAIQHFAPPHAWGGDAWFALRCHAAEMMGDEALAADLVDEYYNNNRRINPELAREMEIERLFSPPGDALDDEDDPAPDEALDDAATARAT
jgi:hypothetical protein